MLHPSDCPRTFSAAFSVSHPHEGRSGTFVEAAFAIQLERELARMTNAYNEERGLRYDRERELILTKFQLNTTTAELERTKEQLDFLKSKGITVGLMKTSDKTDPYLVYVIEPESELCNLALVNKLIDANIERDRTKEQLRVAREALEECSAMTSEHSVHNAAKDALNHLAQSNPDKEEPNVSP